MVSFKIYLYICSIEELTNPNLCIMFDNFTGMQRRLTVAMVVVDM